MWAAAVFRSSTWKIFQTWTRLLHLLEQEPCWSPAQAWGIDDLVKPQLSSRAAGLVALSVQMSFFVFGLFKTDKLLLLNSKIFLNFTSHIFTLHYCGLFLTPLTSACLNFLHPLPFLPHGEWPHLNQIPLNRMRPCLTLWCLSHRRQVYGYTRTVSSVFPHHKTPKNLAVPSLHSVLQGVSDSLFLFICLIHLFFLPGVSLRA